MLAVAAIPSEPSWESQFMLRLMTTFGTYTHPQLQCKQTRKRQRDKQTKPFSSCQSKVAMKPNEWVNEWMTEWEKHWVTDGLCMVCTWNCKIYLLFYLHKFPGGNCKHILMHSAMAQRQWRGDEAVKKGRQHDQHKCAHAHTLTEPLMVHLRVHRLHDITAARAKASAYTLYYCHVWQRDRNLYKAANWAHSMQPTHTLSLSPLALCLFLFVSSLLHTKCIAWY